MPTTIIFRKNYWYCADKIENLVSLKDAAIHSHVSRQTIKRWLAQEKLKGLKCYGKWYVLVENMTLPI